MKNSTKTNVELKDYAAKVNYLDEKFIKEIGCKV